MQYNSSPFRLDVRGQNVVKEDLTQANYNFQLLNQVISPSDFPSLYDPEFNPPVGAVFEQVLTYSEENLQNLPVLGVPLNLNLHQWGFELWVITSNLKFTKFEFTLGQPPIQVEFAPASTFGFYKALKIGDTLVNHMGYSWVALKPFKIEAYNDPPFYLYFHQPSLRNPSTNANIYLLLRRIA